MLAVCDTARSPCINSRVGCKASGRSWRSTSRSTARGVVRASAATDRQAENAVRGTAEDDAPDLRVLKDKRWSNLDAKLQHKPGTVLGSVALIAGTTIGAGILALPAVTKDAGFVPASATLTAFYIFSVISGLLIAEVNINTVCELGNGAVSLQSMAERTLGRTGSLASSAAYVFLHYALLVAYISRAGAAVSGVTNSPEWATAAGFTVALGGLCYASNTRTLDTVNSGLLVAVILSFIALLVIAAPGVHPENLAASNWGAVIDTLPIVALAFVYHNIVPVVVSNLEGDVAKIRLAIWGGLAVPLLMFVGWEAAMLGSIAPGAAGADPVALLQDASPTVAPLIQAFSFLAIATSFIGFVLGLTDFFSDALSLGTKRWPAYALTLLPPYGLALAFPEIFFQALDSAGTYGVLVLFGLLPAAMSWSERYQKTTVTSVRVAPDNAATLLAVGGISAVIIANDVVVTASAALQ